MSDDEIAHIFYPMRTCTDNERLIAISIGRAIERISRRAALEEASRQWDGCFYDGVGERIEIGAAIRALATGETN
jgi:hypothetical protein